MATTGQSPMRQLIFYLRGYKVPLFLNILCNILMAVCMVISIAIIIPFFQILFGRVKPSPVAVPISVNKLQPCLQYVFVEMVELYSHERALLIVYITFVVIFFLSIM